MAEIRSGHKEKALVLIEQILRANPSDPYAKASQIDLKASLSNTLNKQDVRLQKRAAELMGKGEWQSANSVLQLIDAMPTGKKDPQVSHNLDLTRKMIAIEQAISNALKLRDYSKASRIAEQTKLQFPEAIHSSVIVNVPKVDEQTIHRRNEILAKASRLLNQCEWEQAEVILINARKQPEFLADQRLLNKLAGIRTLQRYLYNIATWKSDPSRRPLTLNAYEQVFKVYPNCVRESYYNYLVEEGINKQNNENYAGAILALSQAKRIYPALARKDQTDQRITLCDSLAKCPDKSRVFASLMSTADQQFRACNCETAIESWRSAEKYIASICSNGEANRTKWEDWRTQVALCEKDKEETRRFSNLLVKAGQAFEMEDCQTAKNLYQEADSLRTRCGVLNKRSLDSSLAACDKCLQRQCFDSTFAKAEMSLSKNFKRDALEYYRRAINCPAPDNQRELLTNKIEQLTCEIENKGCPSIASPLTDTIPQLKLYFSLSGGLVNPTLSNGNQQMSVLSSTHFTVGLTADYTPLNGFISTRAGIQFAHYNLYSTLPIGGINDKFNIGTIRVPIGIRLHATREISGKFRPYIFIEYSFAKPVRFNYRSEVSKVNESNLKTLASAFSTLSGGIGIERNRKESGIFFEIGYQAVINNIFNGSHPINNNYYSNNRINIWGGAFGIRFH